MHLLLMYRHKMIGNKDLEVFSGDFRESLMRVIEGFSGKR